MYTLSPPRPTAFCKLDRPRLEDYWSLLSLSWHEILFDKNSYLYLNLDLKLACQNQFLSQLVTLSSKVLGRPHAVWPAELCKELRIQAVKRCGPEAGRMSGTLFDSKMNFFECNTCSFLKEIDTQKKDKDLSLTTQTQQKTQKEQLFLCRRGTGGT